MKKVLAAVLSLALLLVLFGLPAQAAPTEVTVWHLFGESDEPTHPHGYYKQWAEDFNAKNPDIHVTVVGGKGATDILTAISSGATPDIFMNYWNNAPQWADAGAIYDLTDFINNDTEWDKDDIMESAWGTCYYDNKFYSIPNSYSSTFMFYRTDILAECGWDHFPVSTEELLQCIKDTTKADANGDIERLGMLPNMPWLDVVLWTMVFDAQLIAEDGVTLTANGPEMISAFSFIKDIYNMYEQEFGWDRLTVDDFGDTVRGNRASASDPVLTGELAMRWNSEGVMAALSEYGKDVAWEMAAIPSPASAGGAINGMFTCNVWEMNAKTANPEVAWTVLSSLTSKETQQVFAAGEFGNGAFYARRSSIAYIRDTLADELGAAKEDPAIGAKVTANLKFTANAMLDGNLRAFPMVPYVNEYITAISDAGTAIINENADPQEALDAAVAKMQDTANQSPYVPFVK